MPDHPHDHDHTRRGFLNCMVWAGAGVLWTMKGGVPASSLIGTAQAATTATEGFSFVQISDSHIGFKNAINTDVRGTLTEAIAQVNALKGNAKLLIHTGDVSNASRDDQWDDAESIVKTAGMDTHWVPGEHDVVGEDLGKNFYARFTKGNPDGGWYSFDDHGVHFIALNNVMDLQSGGLGTIGAKQLEWLAKDLHDRPASQPIVVFAHVPLWIVYKDWGWGTADGEQALSLLKRFGSVTVLNGHIHQILQKVEGNVSFHTARSTAFPQPVPGEAASPGPIRDLPPGRLKQMLGTTVVKLVQTNAPLAITDSTLA